MQKGIPLPNKMGVQDPTFRMPGPVEFPKFAYRKDAKAALGYVTQVVHSQEEQDSLGKDWVTNVKDIHELLESSLAAVPEEANQPVETKADIPAQTTKKLTKTAKLPVPVIPGVQNQPIPSAAGKVGDIVTNALIEIGAVAPGENPDPSEAQFALTRLNKIVDSWNTKRVYIYANQLLDFIITPGLQPHTIGPTPTGNPQPPAPTFVIKGSRPVRISNANIILNNVFPAVRNPLKIRDSDWWAGQRLQGITTTLPTDLYYSADWPNGSLFLWPVPSFAYGLELELETILQGFNALGDTFTAPPGYPLALELTLAELLCPSFERQPSPVLISAASEARRAIAGLNAQAPRIALDEFKSSSGRPAPSFNYRTGGSTS
jgi:hypothetical protein